MKQTAVIGLLLTFLMALIVLAAAFLFLFQGRQVLEQRLETAQAETTARQQELLQVEATMSAVIIAQATAEAENFILEGQLVQSEQEIARLRAQLAILTATLTQTDVLTPTTPQAVSVPFIAIISPTNGMVFTTGQAIEVRVVAHDAAGIAAIALTANENAIGTFQAEEQTIFFVQHMWRPPRAGTYELSATAVNVNDLSSEPVTVTVTVQTVEQ